VAELDSMPVGKQHRGVGGLVAQGVVLPGGPLVVGQWGLHGFGYSTTSMRAAAAAIIAACDEADAMAAERGGQPC
jgi:hypothetical protein